MGLAGDNPPLTSNRVVRAFPDGGEASGTDPFVRHCASSIEDVALIALRVVVPVRFLGRVNGPHKKHPKCEVLVVVDAERFYGWQQLHDSWYSDRIAIGFIQSKRIQVKLLKPIFSGPTVKWIGLAFLRVHLNCRFPTFCRPNPYAILDA
jgi:hypothetical protein